MQKLDFDSVGETAWGLHGAVPLMRAVGRVLNEMHRPVEVYKVRKSPFVLEPLALFINAKTISFYRDRLGASIRKVDGKGVFCRKRPGPC
eukprot:COSAG06_NODE_2199_length_7365_cov_4.321222_6_plen_90_part_00